MQQRGIMVLNYPSSDNLSSQISDDSDRFRLSVGVFSRFLQV